MIRVDRNKVSPPEILRSARAEEARGRLWEVYRKGKLQEKLIFDESLWRDSEVAKRLRELFQNKCAFCELPLESNFLVEHLRPKMQAVSADGKVELFHYFWLAYEWDNLFLICNQCNARRGSRFPVKGTRASVGASERELAAEDPLVLNPCEDSPERHLVFSRDGLVTSETEKGRTTIELFNLNRPDSQSDRKKEHALLESELAVLADKPESEWTRELEALNDSHRPYAGMRRQFINEWLQAQSRKSKDPGQRREIKDLVQGPVFSKKRKGAIKSNYQEFSNVQQTYSLENAESKSHYYAYTRWIEKIEIHNFRIIKDLTLFPTAARRSEGPWLMLLGENGSGKSSILQAITLTLIDDRYRAKLGVKPEDVLRNRCRSGYVKIHLAGASQPIELHFSRNNPDFDSNSPNPKLLLLGYGATRLLPRRGEETMPGTEYAHVDNLFDPFIPLKDASAWLYKLNEKDKARFDNVARALKNMLTMAEADELVCDPDIPGRVNIKAFGQTVSIKKQSDGYQTVLALACDIMAILLEGWETMEVAEGIVLIDEIGSHLHPRWQMQVINCLRQVFPRVQFLVTTHYPLCLRGLHNRELVVLQRSPQNKIVAIDRDLPDIEGMRVDQLLTSEYFGLNSTIDPDLEERFNEYYALLALHARTKIQEDRLDELKAQLDQHRVYGSTRRQRLAMEAIDEFLAREPEIVSLEQRTDLKEETKKKVAELWAQVRGNQ